MSHAVHIQHRREQTGSRQKPVPPPVHRYARQTKPQNACALTTRARAASRGASMLMPRATLERSPQKTSLVLDKFRAVRTSLFSLTSKLSLLFLNQPIKLVQ